jgi:hypothetical protein|tara:strand:- start:341 stop:1300 length:960 start_codon:yes stop_codon:yes gene_type:complete
MSKLLETLGKVTNDFFKENPKAEAMLEAGERDILSILALPTKAIGGIKRGVAGVGESAAGVVQSAAKLADDYGPEIRMGKKGPSVSLLDPANRIPLSASQIADGMGNLKESARKASEEKTDAEKIVDLAISAKDANIGHLLNQGNDFETKSGARIEEVLNDPARGAGAARKAGADEGEDLDFSALGDLLKEKLGGVAESLKDPVGSAKSLKDKYVGAVGDKVSDLTEGISTSDELFEEYYDTPAGEAKIPAAPKAEVVSEGYEDQAIALFKNTHGTSFDPKSSMDRGKLENMKSLLADMGGLGEMTPNQFALQFYREYP